MNDQVDEARTDRSASRAHFHTRLSRYRSLWRRQWWVLVLGALVGIGVQAVRQWCSAPAYASLGRMIVSIKLNIAEGSFYTEELSNFLGTQAALMQSGLVVQRAHGRVTAQKPELRMQPVGLKVTVWTKTTIFVRQASASEPAYTQAFLQACMEEYIALKKEMRTQTSDTTVAGLTEEVMRIETYVRNAEADTVTFESTNSVVLAQDQGNSAGNYLAALNQRLAAQKSEYDMLQMLTVDQSLNRQQDTAGALVPATSATENSTAAGGERTDVDYYKAKQQLLL